MSIETYHQKYFIYPYSTYTMKLLRIFAYCLTCTLISGNSCCDSRYIFEVSSFWIVSFSLTKFLNISYAGGRFSKEFLKSLTVILSHLFARRVRLHDYILLRPHSTSKVQLEDLPPTFKKGLAKYNDRVRGIFDLYLRTVAAHVYETMGEDNTLPLSHLKFISYKKSSNAPISSESGLTVEEKLQSLSLPYKACSAFAALSGNTDNRLYSSEDLMSNIRYQVRQ